MRQAESDARVEQLLRKAAQAVVYPPTPDLRAGVTAHWAQSGANERPTVWGRRWAASAAALLVLLAVVLGGTPQVRAGLGEWLRVGAVQIWLRSPGPESTPTPFPDQVTWEQLAGATTLVEAQTMVGFDIMLPGYPRGLGMPDKVFVQEFGVPSAILLWLARDGVTVELALFELGSEAIVQKVAPRVLQEVTVRGQRGIWATGSYLVVMGSGAVEIRRVVSGEALIWEEGGVTFRLETRAGLEEALRIAESLRVFSVR